MGIEFMSDAKRLDQAGSAKEDRRPRGFVTIPLFSWIPAPGQACFSILGGCAASTNCPVTQAARMRASH